MDVVQNKNKNKRYDIMLDFLGTEVIERILRSGQDAVHIYKEFTENNTVTYILVYGVRDHKQALRDSERYGIVNGIFKNHIKYVRTITYEQAEQYNLTGTY